MTHAPSHDDVVIRRNPSTGYLLGTPFAPNQYIVATRDEAVSQAMAYAQRALVTAWFDNGNDEFVLLGTFRAEQKVATTRQTLGGRYA